MNRTEVEMLRLPYPAADPLRLADWLELNALLSPDANSSHGDLERALRKEGVLEAEGRNAVERKCLEVFLEIEQRSMAANTAYPFEIRGGVLESKSRRDDFAAYCFCLCLSFFGWVQKKGSKVFPTRLFEHLSCLAAKNFVNGQSVKFGFPRNDLPRGFTQAVNELCKRLGEGSGFGGQPTDSDKDDGLDVVAWRDFPDGLPGKLLLFGQCASGLDWESKTKDLQPDSFCKNWMTDQPISPLIKAFFTPHRVEMKTWNNMGWRAGIVFDRCRIAYLVNDARSLRESNQYIKLINNYLKKTNL